MDHGQQASKVTILLLSIGGSKGRPQTLHDIVESSLDADAKLLIHYVQKMLHGYVVLVGANRSEANG
jgi:hypothetical protein